MSARAAAVLLALGFAAPALAGELPPRKPGLWEVVTVAPGPRSAVKHCVGPDKDWPAPANCSKHEVTKTGAGYALDADCASGGYVSKDKGLVTGDFETSVHSETDTVTTGPSGRMAMKTIVDQRRLGDCEAGQKPGDIILPDGRVMKFPAGK